MSTVRTQLQKTLSALALAANRGLIEDTPGVEGRRAEFATQLRAARRLAARGL